MKFGIIGFGRIAHKFAKSIEYTDEGEVYAIASRSLNTQDDYIKDHPQVVIYKTYEDLLNDSEVEAIYIALPHKFHKEWVIKALEAKKAVLCEKPAVLDHKDLFDIKKVSIDNNTYFLEALKTKFNVGNKYLKQDLELIGKVKSIDANFCFDISDYYDPRNFLFDQEQGGCLNDVGGYLIGFIIGLNNTKLENISGQIDLYNGIEMHFDTTFQFEDGMIATIEGAINKNRDRYALIIGEHGQIMVPMFNRITNYVISLNNGEVIERSYPIYGDDMTMEIQEIINDVRDGKINNDTHSIDDSIRIQQIIEMIRNNSNKMLLENIKGE